MSLTGIVVAERRFPGQERTTGAALLCAALLTGVVQPS
jgi:hypothetical protein